jgi:hypothetical protein
VRAKRPAQPSGQRILEPKGTVREAPRPKRSLAQATWARGGVLTPDVLASPPLAPAVIPGLATTRPTVARNPGCANAAPGL